MREYFDELSHYQYLKSNFVPCNQFEYQDTAKLQVLALVTAHQMQRG